MLDLNTKENLHPSEQTIFAWASAMGKAGVAVLRLSGSHIENIANALGVASLPPARTAQLTSIKTPQGHLIDQCLLLYFPAPHSFTGEDVLELHTHGSPAIMQLLTETLSTLPHCRMAEAGEFSRRAFTNQKMDLVEAEGLIDLINAETTAQHQQALRQMQGHIGKEYDAFRDKIIYALAMMEAYIDFPDEEIPDHVTQASRQTIETLMQDIAQVLDDNQIGEKIRTGLTAIVLGPPNAGKSSLINALAKRDVAIVSDIAGTTRDMIEVHLTLDGISLTLIDTAGLRESEETIEREGIRRATEKANSADIIIFMSETNNSTDFDADKWLKSANIPQDNILYVNSKSDLRSANCDDKDTISVNTKFSHGLDPLITQLKKIISTHYAPSSTTLITRQRHRLALQEAHDALQRYLMGDDLLLQTEDLRFAAQAIAKITGRIDVDDVLDIVFSSFCIGK